jgi:hypothetical protein
LPNNTNSTNLKKSIIDALRKHPEGLTLRDISEIVGKHRHTITKYVYELIGAQVIYERDVGAAKLCYLRENYNGTEKKKKGQVQLIAILMLLLLVPATVIVAQNVTNSSDGSGSLEGMLTGIDTTLNESLDDVLSEPVQNDTGDLPDTPEPPENETEELNDTSPPSPPDPPDAEENLTESNETLPQDSQLEENETLANETLNETETNVTIPDEEQPPVNETNITLPNATIPEIPEINETINETNITLPNATIPAINETNITIPNETAPIENQTGFNETQNVTENETIIIEENITNITQEPELSLDIITPGKITRGQRVELFAVVDNIGDVEAKSVQLEWILPDIFTLIEGALIYDCEDIAPHSTCTSVVTVYAKEDSPLGSEDVKVRVSYV